MYNYKDKYLKYKLKYLNFKDKLHGGSTRSEKIKEYMDSHGASNASASDPDANPAEATPRDLRAEAEDFMTREEVVGWRIPEGRVRRRYGQRSAIGPIGVPIRRRPPIQNTTSLQTQEEIIDGAKSLFPLKKTGPGAWLFDTSSLDMDKVSYYGLSIIIPILVYLFYTSK